MTKKFSVPFIVAVVLFSSCQTYYIPVSSFKEQFRGMDSAAMREVTTQGPWGERVSYLTYPINFIEAVDRSGNPVSIPNRPSIEIRFTDSSNKKTIFYFDLISFDGTYISGRQSRMIAAFKKSIPISSIKKIEVQDGRKNFRYVK